MTRAGAVPGGDIYNAMGSDYENMVAWDARITNETPFFKDLFAQRSVRSVADVACGVGRHSAAFASWGLEVVGVDPSEELLALARAHSNDLDVQIEFVHSDFLHLAASLDRKFDAVVCIGNSLQHLLISEEVLDALGQMSAILETGGTLVAQNRSAERIWARGTHLLAPALRSDGERDLIFLRLVDVHPPTATLNIIKLVRDGESWDADTKTTELRPIARPEMSELLARVGFGEVDFYGDYQRTPFAGELSEDLLVVATKTGDAA